MTIWALTPRVGTRRCFWNWEVADTEKSLRIHTFFQTGFLLALLVVGLLRYVSSRTWDHARRWARRMVDVMGEQAEKFFVGVLHGGLVSMHDAPRLLSRAGSDYPQHHVWTKSEEWLHRQQQQQMCTKEYTWRKTLRKLRAQKLAFEEGRSPEGEVFPKVTPDEMRLITEKIVRNMRKFYRSWNLSPMEDPVCWGWNGSF